jgi:hypothetical protein
MSYMLLLQQMMMMMMMMMMTTTTTTTVTNKLYSKINEIVRIKNIKISYTETIEWALISIINCGLTEESTTVKRETAGCSESFTPTATLNDVTFQKTTALIFAVMKTSILFTLKRIRNDIPVFR